MTLLVAWLWQGIALTVVAGLCLAWSRRLNATTRHLAWWGTLAAVLALLPLQARVSSPAPWAAGPSSAALSAPAPAAAFEVPALPEWTLSICVGLWLGTVLLAFLRIARSAAHVAALKRGSRPLPPSVEAQLGWWMEVRGTGRPASVRVSDDVGAPCALGLGSAVVLLPATLASTLAFDDLDRIVVHEYAHLRRRDDWWRLLQACVDAVVGLHPAVRWIGRNIDIEREAACDDFVVARTGAAHRYATCLADVAQRTMLSDAEERPPIAMLAPGVARSRSVLQQRVRRLLDRRRNGSVRAARLGLASGLAALTAAVVALGQTGPIVVFFDATSEARSLPPAAPREQRMEPTRPLEPRSVVPQSLPAAVKSAQGWTPRAAVPRGGGRAPETGLGASGLPVLVSLARAGGVASRPVESAPPEPLMAAPLHVHMTALPLHPSDAPEGEGGTPAQTAGVPQPWRALSSASVAVGSSTKKSGIAVGNFFARAGQAIAATF